MKDYESTEIAYKNGYEQGKKDALASIVHCKDCKHRGEPKECFMCFTAVEDVGGGRMYRFHDLTTPEGFCNRGAKMDLKEEA